MGTMKIILSVYFAFMVIFTVSAQADIKMQTAFSESIKTEISGNYAESIAKMKSVYKTEDYNVNARLGWLSFLAKQYTESITYYDRAIKLKPYAIEAKFGMIKALNALESWDKVKEQYENILKIDDQNTTSLYWLGVLLYNRKDFDGAARNLEKIVNLYPMDYGSVIMLAWTKYYQGKLTDAKVLFTQALLLSPNDASATSGLNLVK